ncbi:MAG: molybdopterin-guanine dinucleotide biosynthesis protein B [Dehalococcoidales bacterium]
MIPTIAFVGRSKSGKTTLLEQMVRGLKLRGYRVAVIKHSHHHFEVDHPGKDTWRLAQAGSDVVAISSPDRMALVEHVDSELPLGEIASHLSNKVDIILAEGYKNGKTPKILVRDSRQGDGHLCLGEDLLTTISAQPCSKGVPQFAEEDVAGILNLIVARIGDNRDKFRAQKGGFGSWHGGCRPAEFEQLLAESAAVHGHICPGQVLGVRMAMRGCQELGIEKPKEEAKRMLVFVEIDRCATDAIQVVTGCKLGKRTMKYVDYGKLAATFVDLQTGNAVRLAVREDVRDKATLYRRQGQTKYDAEVEAYKVLPDEELFNVEKVLVHISAEDMPGPPRRRVICEACGEGINDGRDVMVDGRVLCRACAYGTYYERHDALEGEYAISTAYQQTSRTWNKTA